MKFTCDGLRPGKVRIDDCHQPDGCTLLRQLVVHAGVVASEDACADDRDGNDVVSTQWLLVGRPVAASLI